MNSQDITLKFVSNSQRSFIDKAKSWGTRASIAFGFGGLAAGASVAIVIAGAVGALTASAVALATPVGWAAIGLLAVGLVCLAARHAYMHKADVNPQTLKELGGNLVIAAYWGTVGAVITGLSIALALSGGGSSDIFLGYYIGSRSDSVPILSTSQVVDNDTPRKPGEYLVYEGSRYTIGTDGKVIITKPESKV